MGFVSPHVPSTEPVTFCPRMKCPGPFVSWWARSGRGAGGGKAPQKHFQVLLQNCPKKRARGCPHAQRPSLLTLCWSVQGGDPSLSPPALPCPRGPSAAQGAAFIWAPWHSPRRFTAGAPLMWAPDKRQEYFRFMTMSARGSDWGGLWAAMFPAAIEAATFLGQASQ